MLLRETIDRVPVRLPGRDRPRRRPTTDQILARRNDLWLDLAAIGWTVSEIAAVWRGLTSQAVRDGLASARRIRGDIVDALRVEADTARN